MVRAIYMKVIFFLESIWKAENIDPNYWIVFLVMSTTRSYSPYELWHQLLLSWFKKTQIIAVNLVMVLLVFKERINSKI